MNIDEFQELARKRRSCHRFKPDPVPEGSIQKILDTARWAMSGSNAQPWEFIVVTDQKVKDAMAEAFRDTRMEHYYMEQVRVEDLRPTNMRKPPTDLPRFKDAPALVVVLGDRRTFVASVLAASYIGNGGSIDSTYQKGMGNVTMMIHLAAASMGLASQWITVIDNWAHLLRPILGVPNFLHIHHVVPIGYPADTPKPRYRRSLEEIIHYNKYDMSKSRTGEQVLNYIRQLRTNTVT